MLATLNASHAISNTASQTLQATLGTYLDITPVTSGAVTTTTITPDTGALAAALVSKFQVNLNTDSQALYLQATTAGAAGNVNALFQQGGQTYLVLANTTTGKVPTAAAIADCKAAAPVAANNANAIAYPIASVSLDNSGTATYDATKINIALLLTVVLLLQLQQQELHLIAEPIHSKIMRELTRQS